MFYQHRPHSVLYTSPCRHTLQTAERCPRESFRESFRSDLHETGVKEMDR